MTHFQHITPGGVLGSTTSRNETNLKTFGSLRGESQQLVTKDTIYDCASLTKSVVTTTLVQKCVADGNISLSDSAATFLPEAIWAKQVTIHDLLSYSIDFNLRLSLLKDHSPQQIKQAVFAAEIDSVAKQNFVNATSMVLGWIIETVTNKPLAQLAQQHIFSPLGMKDSSLMHSKDKQRTAPSEIDGWRNGEVSGEVHDESAWIFAQQGQAVGSAGLFSTVPDLLLFADWKLQHLTSDSESDFLGWEKNAAWMPELGNDLYGKSGFTGCGLIFNPQHKSASLLLMNATYPHRPTDRKQLNQFRKEMLTQFFALSS